MSTKSQRRLLVLVVLVVLGAIAAGALLGVRKWQRQRYADSSGVQARELLAKGDYYEALGKFKKFLDIHPDDREALLGYAKSRENVEEPDGRHVLDAIKVYQKAYAMDRTDRKTADKLLELFVATNMNAEARNLAAELRPKELAKCTKDDLFVLRREVSARVSMDSKDKETEVVLRRVMALDPSDFATRVLLAEWLRDQGRPADARALAEELLKDPESKARGDLLMALVRSKEAGYDAGSALFAALCDLTGLDPENAGVRKEMKLESPLDAMRYAALFDSLSKFGHATAVLQEGTRLTKDASLQRAMTRRLWMLGRPADALTQTSDASLAPDGTHTETLVYRALSLITTDRRAEAAPIFDALRARKGDFRATAWSKAFEAIAAETPKPAIEEILILKEANRQAPLEPVISSYLGDTYQTLGRYVEARQQWEKAGRSGLSTGWSLPWLRITSMMLAQGRAREAYNASMVCARIAPRSMTTYAAVFSAEIAMIMAGFDTGNQPQQILNQADRVDGELALSPQTDDLVRFRDALVPGRALLTSRVKGKQQGANLIQPLLTREPMIAIDVLEQLSRVDGAEQLGLGQPILDSMQKVAPGSTQTVTSRARFLYRNGKKTEALAAFDEASASANPDQKLPLRQARAAFLDAAGDPQAKDAWASLADTYKDNIAVQFAALQSPSVATDLALIDRLAERAKALGLYEKDSEPAPLRLARSRALLREPVNKPNRDEAVGILRDLVSSERDWLDARILLAQALLLSRPDAGIAPEYSAAAEQIRVIVGASPDPDRWNFELARIQTRMGEMGAARNTLDRLANSPAVDPEVRLASIDLLIEQREMDSVRSALERIASLDKYKQDVGVKLRRAGVARSLRRDDEAKLLYRELASMPLTMPEQILTVADALASLGDAELSKQTLEKIGALTLEPGVRETVMARYMDRRGDPAAARRLLEEAVKLAPQRADAWTNLVAYHVERGEGDLAKQAIARAKEQLKDASQVSRLEQQLDLATKAGKGDMDLAGMAAMMAKDPANAARADAIRAIDQARKDESVFDQTKLQQFRDRFKNDPAVLTLLAQVLLDAKPPRIAQASDVLRGAMREHPRAVEPTTSAVRVFRAQQNWAEMLLAAKAWQQITREPAADVAAAEAMLNLDRRDGVFDELRPHLAGAREKPSDPFSLQVLDLQSRALVRGNRSDEARRILEPLLSSTPPVRSRIWVPLAGTLVKDLKDSTGWLEAAAALTPGENEEEQVGLASAYIALSQRFPESSVPMIDKARSSLEALAAKPGASAMVFESLAQVHALRKDTEAALASFDKAIALNASSVYALRGSADLLAASNPTEAMKRADKALTIAGPTDLECQAAVGRAATSLAGERKQRKDSTGERAAYQRAAEAFGAIAAVRINEPAVLAALIASLDGAGRVGEALPYFDRLAAMQSLPEGMNRATVQNNYADAIVRSGKGGADLDRAKSLAEAAVQALPLSATYDTLGNVLRARGDRAGAVRAYRKALEIDKDSADSTRGLALALAGGAAAEREEAKALTAKLRGWGQPIPEELAALK